MKKNKKRVTTKKAKSKPSKRVKSSLKALVAKVTLSVLLVASIGGISYMSLVEKPLYKVGQCLLSMKELTVVQIVQIDSEGYHIEGVRFIFPFKEVVPLKKFHERMKENEYQRCEDVKDEDEVGTQNEKSKKKINKVPGNYKLPNAPTDPR